VACAAAKRVGRRQEWIKTRGKGHEVAWAREARNPFALLEKR